MKISRPLLFFGMTLGALALFVGGCATPGAMQPTHTRILDPSQEDNIGGSFLESSDIQTIASRMCGEILTLPEISGNPGLTRIALAPVRNSTRYVIDKDILMKRLRMELSRHSRGQVRFFSQRVGGKTRTTMLREQQEDALDETLDSVAAFLASSHVVTSAPRPLTVSVTPAKNTNFVNLNADSYVALLRAKVSEKAGGRILFAAPGTTSASLDYKLTGEFIARSIKKEGMLTPFEEETDSGKQQKEMDVSFSVTEGGAIDASVKKSQSAYDDRFDVDDYKDIPDVTKYLNVMLIDTDTDIAVLEKLFTIEKKVRSGIGRADFLLTGELSALSKASTGDRSDYVLMTFQLVDPQTNEILWEDGYETKRVTSVHVIYR